MESVKLEENKMDVEEVRKKEKQKMPKREEIKERIYFISLSRFGTFYSAFAGVWGRAFDESVGSTHGLAGQGGVRRRKDEKLQRENGLLSVFHLFFDAFEIVSFIFIFRKMKMETISTLAFDRTSSFYFPFFRSHQLFAEKRKEIKTCDQERGVIFGTHSFRFLRFHYPRDEESVWRNRVRAKYFLFPNT
jgi:hypothetical protein